MRLYGGRSSAAPNVRRTFWSTSAKASRRFEGVAVKALACSRGTIHVSKGVLDAQGAMATK